MRKLAFLYLFLALSHLIILNCSLEPFDMPSWDVELNLPVITEDYTFRDLADDEDAIQVVNDSLVIEITEALAEIDLAGRFDLNPYLGDFGSRIGAFEVKAIPPANAAFTIGEVWEDAGLFSGLIEVPPFCFPGEGVPSAEKVIDLGGDFSWAEVAAGVLDITVENRLAVPLGNPAGGCPFMVRVNWAGGAWDSVVFDEPIPPGASREAEVDLGGKTIANSVTVSLTGGSPGSDGEVDFSATDEIGIDVAPHDITVDRALAGIPPQSFESERSITIEDSTRVVLAGIESGTLCLDVFNNMPIGLSVDIATDNLTHEGAPLAYSTSIDAFCFDDVEIDISGYTLETGSVEGDPWYGTNTVTFEVRAETPGTAGHVEMASSDSVRIAVEMSDVVFDRVTGTLKPTPVAISEVHEIDLPEVCRAVSFSEATMVLGIRNQAMVGGDFEVEITGEREGESETAVLSGEIVPADLSGSPSEVEYEYDSQEIRNLISLGPDLIRVEGDATVWGQGRVYSTDALEGDLTITVPLVFEVEKDTVEFDPRDVDIPLDVRDEIRDAARAVVFWGRLVTDFDLSGAFNVYLGADSAGTYEAPLISLEEPGGFAPFGNAGPGENEFEVHLTQEDLEIFLRESIWVGLEVLFDSTEAAVTARPGNYFRLEGCLRLKRRVD